MKKKMKKFFLGHFRKIALLLFNFCFNRRVFLKLVGRFNRRHGFLKTVFVAYPATEEYALEYVYPSHRHWMRWRPWPAGVFRQNGKWGLMLVISSTEKDFIPENRDNLQVLVEETEKFRRILGAENKTFAGVIPGVLSSLGLLKNPIEREITVKALVEAEKTVRERLGLGEVPIILLGGKGFIGAKLQEKLTGREVFLVDVNSHPGRANLEDWPADIKGREALLVNLTRASTIELYVPFFWPELTLLNEAYPAPEREAREISAIGASTFHLAGVRATSFPSFPKAYKGGIPCCAAWPSEDMRVIVRELD